MYPVQFIQQGAVRSCNVTAVTCISAGTGEAAGGKEKDGVRNV